MRPATGAGCRKEYSREWDEGRRPVVSQASGPGIGSGMVTMTNEQLRTGHRWIFAVPVAIVLLDQALKALMTAWIGPGAAHHRHDLVGTSIGFHYVENRGAAFGILPDQTRLLTVLAIGIALFGLAVMWRESRVNSGAALAIGLIVGGAFGNIVDRLRLGYVVDFIAVGAWPKFNLADSMVTIGVIWLLWASFQDEQGRGTHKTEESIDE